MSALEKPKLRRERALGAELGSGELHVARDELQVPGLGPGTSKDGHLTREELAQSRGTSVIKRVMRFALL